MTALIRPFNGLWPRIDETAFIADNAVIIGDVVVGPESSVWYGCVLRGDVNRIRVGARTNIQDGTVVHVAHDPAGNYLETGGGLPTVIGDDITIGHMALIHACTVESGAFIGMRATVMDGAVIERDAMVAAGALVTAKKRVAAGELWGGSPAKKMRDLSEEDKAGLAYSARHYAKLARRYREAADAT